MNGFACWWAWLTRAMVFTLVPSALAFGSAGCSILAGLTNPKVAFALNEPATMSVIVRRVEVAAATADEIERLIGETGIDETSAWTPKTTLATADAEALLKTIGTEPVYAKTKVRILPAEAWARQLGDLCSQETGSPSLVALLGPETASAYAVVASEGKTLGELHLKVATEQAALDAKGVSAADTTAHEAEKKKLLEEVDKIEAAHEPKVEALIKQVKEAAGKLPADKKTKLLSVVQNLRAAASDAKNANDAAMIRYPLAIPSLTTDLQTSAKRFVADIVEQQLGDRPNLDSLQPDVKLDGTDVKLVINGIPADKLGSIKPADVITGTTVRTKDYVGRVLTLVGLVSETGDRLKFDADVLDAWIGGIGAAGTPPTNLADLVVTEGAPPAAAAAPAAAPASKPQPGLQRGLGGLFPSRCAKAAPPAGPATAAAPAAPGAGAGKPGAPAPRPTATAGTPAARPAASAAPAPAAPPPPPKRAPDQILVREVPF